MKAAVSLVTMALAGCAGLADFDRSYRQEARRIDAQSAGQPNQQVELIKARAQQRQQDAAAPSATAAQASWTGASVIGTSVTGAHGFNCEYTYAGKRFWRMFSPSCPSSIAVQ